MRGPSAVLPEPPEVTGDLTLIGDLLDLEEAGERVTWHEGLNRIIAKKLLERHQKAKSSESTQRVVSEERTAAQRVVSKERTAGQSIKLDLS